MPPTAGIDSIITATSDYKYDDFPVVLHVGEEVFKISSSRLAQHSPVFKEMFCLPQPVGEVRSIVLHIDAGEFRDFLWYIHADPFTAKRFLDSKASPEKFSRLLGIALVAYMYDAEQVAGPALTLALDMAEVSVILRMQISLDRTIFSRLVRIAGTNGDPDFTRCCLDLVCHTLRPLCEVPSHPGLLISLARVARELDNTFVLAHAYYYILKLKDDVWLTHPDLDATDRRRLLCGSHALHTRSEARRKAPPEVPIPPNLFFEWQFEIDPEIRDIRENLWNMFDCDKWRLDG